MGRKDLVQCDIFAFI